ncbi:MAG: GNAT family N-acetyltransferase [Bdellovibrionaceae bacterium]|nr:GNAT family N-acetyltransferase [Pseudobdellovibrionaceae bacterium]
MRSTTGPTIIPRSSDFNNHCRKGYAREALKATITFAFRNLKFHRLTAEIEKDNLPANKMVKKIGFRKEAVAKKLFCSDGKWNDAFILALTAEEWVIKRMQPMHRLAAADS